MEERVARLLELVDGPGWQGREALDRAAEEVRAAGIDTAVTLLAVNAPEWETRCRAVAALLFVDAARTVDLVVPLLHDPELEVRWHTCGCLHDFGDERVIEPLVAILEGDPDPQMRTNAAYALGGVGSPAAIPALLRALNSDHEADQLGHSASWCAATALAHILGPDQHPDEDRLREVSQARYREWATSQAESDGETSQEAPD